MSVGASHSRFFAKAPSNNPPRPAWVSECPGPGPDAAVGSSASGKATAEGYRPPWNPGTGIGSSFSNPTPPRQARPREASTTMAPGCMVDGRTGTMSIPSRSKSLVIGAVVLLLATAAILLRSRSRRPPAGRPDIVLIVWDTCRADRISALGYPKPTTPRLDALAAEGVRFTACFAPAPWTGPSHASLFTGVLPHRHGYEEKLGGTVRPDIPLLAETLRAAGYETVGFTANAMVSSLTGLDRGFEEFHAVYENDAGDPPGDRALRKVRDWLASRTPRGPGDRPLFFFFNMMDTHVNVSALPEDIAVVRDPAVSDRALRQAAKTSHQEAMALLLGLGTVDEETFAGISTRYDASVRFVDRRTGEILDLLEGRGLLGNSLVAVTSDHGENLGDHGLLDHRASVHDTLLHVPLVIRAPGRFEGGRTVARQVSLMDLHPTLLKAAGVKSPPGTGLDALPLDHGEGPGRVLTASEEPTGGFVLMLKESFPGATEKDFAPLYRGFVAARDPAGAVRPRKYIRVENRRGDVPVVLKEELFDIASDPGETRNLLEGTPDPADREAAERLRRAIEDARKPR